MPTSVFHTIMGLNVGAAEVTLGAPLARSNEAAFTDDGQLEAMQAI